MSSEVALQKLSEIALKVYTDLENNEIPKITLPTRAKSNIRFDEKLNVWKYGKNRTSRSAKTLDGAYMLLRTMYVAEFIKTMIEQNKSSTLRELYYISEGWDLAKFNSQQESDNLAEDLETITGCLREALKPKPVFYKGKRLYTFTYPEGARGGVFSKTIIEIDDKTAVNIRCQVIRPQQIWK